MVSEHRGFTIVEVVVATSLASFITLVAVGALKTISSNAARVQDHCDTVSELHHAAALLKEDLGNVYRDTDARRMKFAAAREPGPSGERLVLTFYTILRAKARPDRAEADVYEVEYYLMDAEDRSMLMRRVWPNPNREDQPGGLLTVLAQDVTVFAIRMYDGQEWTTEWAEDLNRIPQLMEVVLSFGDENTPQAWRESIVVHLVRPDTQQAGQAEQSPAAESDLDRLSRGMDENNAQ